MTIDDIKALIASDESRTLELKKTTGELKDGMHAACAFLNTEGGWLIFGVAPKSLKIIGQEVTDDTQREIAQAIAGLQPAVDMRPIYVDVPEHPGSKLIAMHFDGWVWGERPHTFHGCPYYKVESTTKVMPQDMYDERIRAFEPKTYSWELRQAEGVALEDLNEKHIRGCIRMGVEGGRIPASALNVAQNVAQNLDERILQIIKSNPSIKREDIANQLSVNKKTVERHLKELGIKWEGPSKIGHWII